MDILEVQKLSAGSEPEHNPIRRFLRNKTRKTAIGAFCAQCMGCTKDSLEVGYKADIRGCTAPECPLYGYRPYK